MKIKSSCGIQMDERPRRDVSDGYSWRCRQCKTRKSIREGSFFSKSKLSLQKWLLLIHLWSTDCPVTSAMEQTATDSRTAVDIYQWLREVCSTKLQQTPIILGGQGRIVQIDESLFRHKPKVRLRVEIITYMCSIIVIYLNSITEEDPQHKKFGYLGWPILHIHQHLGMWRLLVDVMQPHYFQ